ncbi:head-tail connector protein [Priestia megaterium]|uniref:head-tail connector protein n=1 Tax=Priestia megaterium TaxID=1404 RepID=UPI003F80DC90
MALEHLVISVTEMKSYLRVDHTADDELLTLLIETAKEQAEAYLNHDFTETDTEGVVTYLTIPSTVKLACMRMVNSWYDYRDDVTETSTLGDRSRNVGEIPWDAEEMLWKYKKLVGT